MGLFPLTFAVLGSYDGKIVNLSYRILCSSLTLLEEPLNFILAEVRAAPVSLSFSVSILAGSTAYL